MAAAAPVIVMGVATVASAAASVVSSVSSNKASQKNYQLQQEQYEYEKNLQSQIMDREDNAIQRQVVDSRAAGISPLYQMAGAQSAGAAGVAVNTPQKEQTPNTMATVLQGIGMMSSLVQSYASLKGTQTDNALKELDLQEKQSSSDNRLALIAEAAGMARKQSDEYDAQTTRNKEMFDIQKAIQEVLRDNAQREYKHKVDSGIYDSDTSIMKNATSVFDLFSGSRASSAKDKASAYENEFGFDLSSAMADEEVKLNLLDLISLSINNIKKSLDYMFESNRKKK